MLYLLVQMGSILCGRLEVQTGILITNPSASAVLLEWPINEYPSNTRKLANYKQ